MNIQQRNRALSFQVACRSRGRFHLPSHFCRARSPGLERTGSAETGRQKPHSGLQTGGEGRSRAVSWVVKDRVSMSIRLNVTVL